MEVMVTMEVMKSVVKMVLILVHLQLYLEVSQNEFCRIYVFRDLHTKFITHIAHCKKTMGPSIKDVTTLEGGGGV